MITLLVAGAKASITIRKTICNYQTETTAIAEAGKPIRVGWQYVGDRSEGTVMQDAYELQVTERLSGRSVFSSGTVRSAESQFIELPRLGYTPGGYQWRVRIARQGEWSQWSSYQNIRVMPALTDGKTRWIGAITKRKAAIPGGRWSNTEFKKDSFRTRWDNVDTLSMKSIVLRKEFRTKARKQVADAVVYVSGLGHYDLHINGERAADSEFAPLWSEYSRTIYYNVYDVTQSIKADGNAIAVMLGNGFFNVQRGQRYSKLQTSFGPPQLFLRLDITYTDGSTQTVRSDATWRWALSPVTFNSIYGGESYDARLEHPGCDKSGYDDRKWQNAVVTEGPEGSLCPQTCQPVKVMERYGVRSWRYIDSDSVAAASQKTKRSIAKGAFVCDMGQNLAGLPEITVSGRRGQKLTLLVSERLTPQGACDQSQTGRQHYYEYTLRGDDGSAPDSSSETWRPRFSYYGFRYIQVEGAVLSGMANPDSLPVISSLHSCFVYNSAPEGSSFWCDNDLFTRTHRLIERAERSNMQAVLTDCPHREKLGWLEQDHLCGPSLLFNYDMTRLVPKIIRDIVDTQQPDGMVPTTAPRYVSFGNLFDDSPEWGSTLVILPFQYYDMYGDSTLITDNYELMRRYVDYLTSRSDSDGIVSHGLGDWYDYGPWRAGFSRNTPVPLVATAHYIYDLQLISKAARMTGRTADEQRYSELCRSVVQGFNRRFYNAGSCTYATGSQTSNALPLFLGIAPDHDGVLQSLIDDIHAHGDRLTTGDVGNRYLFRVLADNGQSELLFNMLNHYDAPGYGHQLAHGATTLTEQWDPRQGSSENHFMMGQIDEWLFRTLSGIRQKAGTHGMRHLVIDPQMVGDIRQLNTTITTLYGEVKVSCDKTSGRLNVVVPGGCYVELRVNN